MVFQKLIDNRIDNTTDTLHYRVPVFFCRNIPLVYEAIVANEYRFKPKNKVTMIKQACDVFTQNEIDNIYIFCREMHLDYCELDILRDIHNKCIYIIDANDTPTVTINGYSKEEMMKGIEIQALCLHEEIKRASQS